MDENIINGHTAVVVLLWIAAIGLPNEALVTKDPDEDNNLQHVAPISAEQSSTFSVNTANLAIDGDLNTCSIAGIGSQSKEFGWWRADLGGVMMISQIGLVNSEEYYDSLYLNNFDISVDVNVIDEPRNICTLFDRDMPVSRGELLSLGCDGGSVTGRYVTIRRRGGFRQDAISLCEVYIYGSKIGVVQYSKTPENKSPPPSSSTPSLPQSTLSTTTLKLTHPISTQQSYTYSTYRSNLAVDGDIKTCSIAGVGSQSTVLAWWQADLGVVMRVHHLEVVNSPMDYESRFLNQFEVFISNNSNNIEQSRCYHYSGPQPVPPSSKIPLPCDSVPLVGRFVTIKRLGGFRQDALSLCEVYIYVEDGPLILPKTMSTRTATTTTRTTTTRTTTTTTTTATTTPTTIAAITTITTTSTTTTTPITSATITTTTTTTASTSMSFKNECGVRNLSSNGGGGYVINGNVAPEGAWPWQAQIFLDSNFYCGGSLINDKWVLTAAHCVNDENQPEKKYEANRFTIRLGTNLLNGNQPQSLLSKVEKVVMHEAFQSYTNANDYALLKLASTTEPSRFINSICLPDSDPQGTASYQYRYCYMSGFGIVDPDKLEPSPVLMEGKMTILTQAECLDNIKLLTTRAVMVIETVMFCGGSTPMNTIKACVGDSGGPLSCLGYDNRWYVHGIVSFAVTRSCGGTVFAKVQTAVDWINLQIKNN